MGVGREGGGTRQISAPAGVLKQKQNLKNRKKKQGDIPNIIK
jgi:hypothetical protein